LASSSTDGRGSFGSGRTIGGSTTNSGGTTNFVFFGYTQVTGSWAIASSGKLLGSLGEVDGSGFSFTGVARPGKSLVLNATESPNPSAVDHGIRHATWSGAPLAAVLLGVTPPAQVDLSGTWIAQGNVLSASTNGSTVQSATELLTLKSLTGGDPTGFFTDLASSPFAAQSYVITGSGPGYTNVGLALQSSKKRLSVVLREGEFAGSNTILRAFEGPLNTNKFISNPMGGTDDNLSLLKYRMQRYVLD
jgi:hypothetical protein